MRTHGWAGSTPVDDDEAAKRIVMAAGELIDDGVTSVNIRQIAQKLSISRQTVYRYFPDTDALVRAAAEHATDEFLRGLADSLRGLTDPAEATVEGIAVTYERLRAHRRFGILFAPAENGRFIAVVTSPEAITLGKVIVEQFDVDWDQFGWTADDLDELVEMMLRMVQSLLADAGDPPRSPAELRRYLHRWVAPAIQGRCRPPV
ncbi:TetR/AcrR family transcriptional regulator [Gordonia sp. CPCC 206044]|uniref:TetR/AcrR family transcriptional regulator n=1 Tax=Gordonia sp. CPCC 206044 TaxID=3140793 RepID=UPI003AF34FF2